MWRTSAPFTYVVSSWYIAAGSFQRRYSIGRTLPVART